MIFYSLGIAVDWRSFLSELLQHTSQDLSSTGYIKSSTCVRSSGGYPVIYVFIFVGCVSITPCLRAQGKTVGLRRFGPYAHGFFLLNANVLCM